MNDRALVDTNILVYYVSAEDLIKHLKAKEFLEKVRNNPSRFVITFQSLREFANVLIKRTTISSAQVGEFIRLFKDVFGDVLHDNRLDLQVAADLARRYEARFYDSLIISTAARYEINTFYTENIKDFERIPGIRVVNPLE